MKFTLRDGVESTVPDYRFQYRGRNDEPRTPKEASYVEIWFPTEYRSEVGPKKFLDVLFDLATKVPFSSGYCSLALNYEDWAAMPAKPIVRPIALRHPGIDVHNTQIASLYLGGGPRGAYWLTFLGPDALDRLGIDVEGIRANLGPEIVVHALPNGVAIQAGADPEPGDVNRDERLPLVRKVAKLIEPVQAIQESAITFGDVDEYIRWQQRHLL
jgi:hypothetical protein